MRFLKPLTPLMRGPLFYHYINNPKPYLNVN